MILRHDRIDTITMTICLQTIPSCADLEGAGVRCPGPHPWGIIVYSIYILKLSQKYASDSYNFGKYNYPSDPPPPSVKISGSVRYETLDHRSTVHGSKPTRHNLLHREFLPTQHTIQVTDK